MGECACGCGLPLRTTWSRGRKATGKFRHGHGRRGVSASPETRKKLSESHQGIGLGREVSAETRRKMSEANTGKGKGPTSPVWRGGRYVEKASGYVYVLVDDDHPLASMRGARHYVREHRLAMAEHLGRPLTDEEVVHHKLDCEGGTGDKTDNRIENLLLFPNRGAHQAHHEALRRLTGQRSSVAG